MDADGYGVIVALALGLAGVFLSFWQMAASPGRERRARLEASRAAGLIEVIELAEARGQQIRDEIYNITRPEREPGYVDRAVTVDIVRSREVAKASAQVAAFGPPAVKTAFTDWLAASANWDRSRADLEYEAHLYSVDAGEGAFKDVLAGEERARAVLEERIQLELSNPSHQTARNQWWTYL